MSINDLSHTSGRRNFSEKKNRRLALGCEQITVGNDPGYFFIGIGNGKMADIFLHHCHKGFKNKRLVGYSVHRRRHDF